MAVRGGVTSSMIVLSNQWKRRFQFAFSSGVIKNMQILLTKLMLIFIKVGRISSLTSVIKANKRIFIENEV